MGHLFQGAPLAKQNDGDGLDDTKEEQEESLRKNLSGDSPISSDRYHPPAHFGGESIKTQVGSLGGPPGRGPIWGLKGSKRGLLGVQELKKGHFGEITALFGILGEPILKNGFVRGLKRTSFSK